MSGVGIAANLNAFGPLTASGLNPFFLIEPTDGLVCNFDTHIRTMDDRDSQIAAYVQIDAGITTEERFSAETVLDFGGDACVFVALSFDAIIQTEVST